MGLQIIYFLTTHKDSDLNVLLFKQFRAHQITHFMHLCVEWGIVSLSAGFCCWDATDAMMCEFTLK